MLKLSYTAYDCSFVFIGKSMPKNRNCKDGLISREKKELISEILYRRAECFKMGEDDS